MACYLFTHNPNLWEWEDIALAIQELKEEGKYVGSWSSGNRKNIEVGDRVFIIRLGVEPKGIFASGAVYNSHYKDIHWDQGKKESGTLANYIDIQFDVILNPETEKILHMEELKQGNLNGINWSARSSGVIIPDDIAGILEEKWKAINGLIAVRKESRVELSTEEIITSEKYYEGAVKSIQVNRYERNAKARSKCLEYHGYTCSACESNLTDVYGEIAEAFIHVHHTIPLSQIGEEYELNPIDDLKPVCPNCHAIIHRFKPELSIEELKEIIIKNTNGYRGSSS